MSKPICWILMILVLLVAGGCSEDDDEGLKADPQAAADARALWEASGIISYTYVIEPVIPTVEHADAYTVEVVDGAVVSVTPDDDLADPDQLGRTVEGMFDDIANDLSIGHTASSATYHETYGYPLSFSFDWVPQDRTDNFSWEVTSFTITGAERADPAVVADQRAIWEADGPASYSYTIEPTQFALVADAYTVEVTDGVVTGITPDDAGAPDFSRTIDEIFDDIEAALAAEHDNSSIAFHGMGFPTSFSYDPDAEVDDDEYSWIITALVPVGDG